MYSVVFFTYKATSCSLLNIVYDRMLNMFKVSEYIYY